MATVAAAGEDRAAGAEGPRPPDIAAAAQLAREARDGELARTAGKAAVAFTVRTHGGRPSLDCEGLEGMSLRDVVEALNDRAMWPEPSPVVSPEDPLPPPDMADVVGQPQARLACEVAAAGGHHLLLIMPM